MSVSIDVVVPAFGWELTERCLDHLDEQTVEHRLIVVANGSTDDIADRVRDRRTAPKVVEMTEIRPFSVACNAGVDAGEGDVVVLLNNDVFCRPGFLERLVAPLEDNSRRGSVVPLLLQPGEERIDSVGLAADFTLAGFPRLHGRPASEASSPWPTLLGPAGAAAAYRRTAWREAGGLDEGIFAYMEDFDLALRLRAGGWETTRALGAVGVHLGSATFGRRSARQRRHGGVGRGYLLRRYGVLRSRAGARTAATELIVVVGDALISRDLAALGGRIEGWRAARDVPRRPPPPPEALDRSISFLDSIRLRRKGYAG